jgi:hypothetical protein
MIDVDGWDVIIQKRIDTPMVQLPIEHRDPLPRHDIVREGGPLPEALLHPDGD